MLRTKIIRRFHTTNSLRSKDIIPRQTKRFILSNSNSKSNSKTHSDNYLKAKVEKLNSFMIPRAEVNIGYRYNAFEIQMLSKNIYKQIFKNTDSAKINPSIIQQCQKELYQHGMLKGQEFEHLADVEFKMPPLYGKDLLQHFQVVGEEQAKPYRQLVLKLLKHIPQPPTEWVMQAGWTRYVPKFNPEPVPYPLEDEIVFDIEVCINAGKAPTVATAVSSKAWYAWVSQSVLDSVSNPIKNYHYTGDVLIPLESSTKEHGYNLDMKFLRPKVVVGHNVSYDRARVKEQYWIERTGTRFIDTMSLHVCVSGITSYQRAVLKSGDTNDEDEAWISLSSLNSLSEVHKLYCGEEIDKGTRNIFIDGSLADVNREFQSVMKYCSNDVLATYSVLKRLFPMFLERFPHPVTFAGMLELSTAYLPINSNWERYISDSEQTFNDMDSEAKFILARRANHVCQLLHDDKFKDDIWMWDQDWEIKNIKLRKTVSKKNKQEDEKNVVQIPVEEGDDIQDPLEIKFKYLEKTVNRLPAVETLLPGYPNWYRKLCSKPDSPDWVPGPHALSTSMRITPKLLGLTWEGYPLHYIQGQGWGFLVPFSDDVDDTKLPLQELIEKCPVLIQKPKLASTLEIQINEAVQANLSKREYYSRLKKDCTAGLYKGSGIWCNTILEDCCWFFKLPHKDGTTHRVGNPLAKDFLNKFSESVLAGDTESAEKVLGIARMLTYWRNNRDRIVEQMLVWLNDEDLPRHLRKDVQKYGAIIPQVVVSGTLTRRAVEPTWMTASNAHTERIGSELRSMIQAPPGYNIVGADVDSQELWIASLVGDAYCAKNHGSTPFGWMNLSGSKTQETDMHSMTAKTVGISRDHAKVINYARIYGAGQNFAEQLLKQFNPTMTENEARAKATKMFNLTKGKRVYSLRKEYTLDLPNRTYGVWEAKNLAKVHGKSIDEMFTKPKWVGGTESAMFNRLEEISGVQEPTTPFLDCRLTRALEPKIMSDDRFLSTRVNWVVQSGAVDFLHLMLVCMRWLMQDRARFSLSFHDEVRYLVPEKYKYQTAMAMHVTNLLTRSFCALKLGINDIPQSVAFFSSVEVDTVLRKDAKADCKTPSNPHGLSNGYGIPHGESLNIYQAIEKADASYVWWTDRKSHVKDKKT